MSETPVPAPGFTTLCQMVVDASTALLESIQRASAPNSDEADDDRVADLVAKLELRLAELATVTDGALTNAPEDRAVHVDTVAESVQRSLTPLASYSDAAKVFAPIRFWLGAALVRWGDAELGLALAASAISADSARSLRSVTDLQMTGRDSHIADAVARILNRFDVEKPAIVRELLRNGFQCLSNEALHTARFCFGLATQLDPEDPEALYGVGRSAFELMAADETRRTRAYLAPMLSAYRSLDSVAAGPSAEAFFPADMEYWGCPICSDDLRWDVGIYIARGLLLIDAPVEARIWLRNLREPDDSDGEPWTHEDRTLLLREINEAIALAAEVRHVTGRTGEPLELGYLHERDIIDGLRSTRRATDEIFGLLLNLARWRSEDRESTGRIEQLLLKIMEQSQRASTIDADAARERLQARLGPQWSVLRGQTQDYFVTGEALFAALDTNLGVAPFPLVIPYAAGLESLLVHDALGGLRGLDGKRVSLGILEEALAELRHVNPQFPQLSESKRRLWDLIRGANVDLRFWLEELPGVLHRVGEIRNPAAHGEGSTWPDVRRIRGLTVDPDSDGAVVPRILGMLSALQDSAVRLRSADRAKPVRRYRPS